MPDLELNSYHESHHIQEEIWEETTSWYQETDGFLFKFLLCSCRRLEWNDFWLSRAKEQAVNWDETLLRDDQMPVILFGTDGKTWSMNSLLYGRKLYYDRWLMKQNASRRTSNHRYIHRPFVPQIISVYILITAHKNSDYISITNACRRLEKEFTRLQITAR